MPRNKVQQSLVLKLWICFALISLQKQNLRADLRRVAKRIRKSARKSQKAVHFTHIIGINLCRLALGGQTVKKTCVYLRPNLSSTKVNASGWPNETQVERKSKTCVDLRVRLARALLTFHERQALRSSLENFICSFPLNRTSPH